MLVKGNNDVWYDTLFNKNVDLPSSTAKTVKKFPLTIMYAKIFQMIRNLSNSENANFILKTELSRKLRLTRNK